VVGVVAGAVTEGEVKSPLARASGRWSGAGSGVEGVVKEPRGKSRREVKNALSEAQKQMLIKIVSDEGQLSRHADLLEAGVLVPLPGIVCVCVCAGPLYLQIHTPDPDS
jgi:hypothetical protein